MAGNGVCNHSSGMGLTLCVAEYLGWSIVTLDVKSKPAMPYQEAQHTHHQMSIQDYAKEEMQTFFAHADNSKRLMHVHYGIDSLGVAQRAEPLHIYILLAKVMLIIC